MSKMAKSTLNPLALGKALGVLWGLCVALCALLAMQGIALPWAALMSIYPGFAPTPLGALLGLVWGFVSGFIAGYLLAWLYNYFA